MSWLWGRRKDAREQGNEHFKAKDLDAAIASYTEGLTQLVGSAQRAERATLLSNRSAAYLSKQRWHEALVDANEAVRIRPDYVKAYSRKGKAHLGMKEFEKSAKAYAQGLERALKQIEDNDQRHTRELDALKSQAAKQSDEYARLQDQNRALQQQLEDYLLMFDKAKKG